jgi:hypothetical protein
MAYEISNYSLRITLEAAADLTASQYCFVKLDSNGKAALCTAVTDKPIGVLQNQPIAGKEAAIVVEGGTKLKVGTGGVTVGDRVGTVISTGRAVSYVPGTDTTKYLVGTVLGTGAAGDLVSAVVSCASAGRGA